MLLDRCRSLCLYGLSLCGTAYCRKVMRTVVPAGVVYGAPVSGPVRFGWSERIVPRRYPRRLISDRQAFTPVGPRADDTDALNPGSVPETLGQTGSTAGTSDPTDDTPTNRPLEEVRSFAGAITVIGVALFTSVPFLLRTARSRARRRAVALGDTCLNSPSAATAAWAETTDLANDYGHPLQPTDTPRTFAGRLTLEAELAGKPALSLTRLRTAYEYEEYAGLDPNGGPDGPSGGVAVLPRSAPPQWDDVDILTRALRDGSSWRTRIRARLLPRSLLNRFRTNARH